MGIGVATTVRIGSLLGSRSSRHVRLSSHTAVFLSTIVGTTVLIVLMLTRNSFGRLFSDEDDVVALVGHVLPYVAAFQIADGWAQSMGGVLRGMGKQALGAGVNLAAYYGAALPLGIWFVFIATFFLVSATEVYVSHQARFQYGFGSGGIVDWSVHRFIYCGYRTLRHCRYYEVGRGDREGGREE